YFGGGNAVLVFQDMETDIAGQFIRKLSLDTLCNAPGLQLVFAQVAFDWGNDSLAATMDKAFQQLAEEKQKRMPSAPLLGLGITASCQSTGLPAIGKVRFAAQADELPISAEIAAKFQAVEEANDRLAKELFDDLLNNSYAFPYDFDKLGRSDAEHSYI